METFENLINREVKRLFLVVWPPLGEEKESDIDISFGFIFNDKPDWLCIVTTDKEDMWTPCIYLEGIPKITYSFSEFAPRMSAWMNLIEESILEKEYYDVTEADMFNNIVASKIQSIELIGLENNLNPFGVKIGFGHDYILSTPISDGNTVETSQFHKNENILNFEKIGILQFKKLTL